jgi:hypothetical protein
VPDGAGGGILPSVYLGFTGFAGQVGKGSYQRFTVSLPKPV